MTKPVFYTTPFEHCQYTLVTNERQLHRAVKDKSLEFLSLEQDAQTRFKQRKGKCIAIVEIAITNRPMYVTHALLAHEAVHIWQEVRQMMGEQDPSCEFEAYSIQRIAQDLFYEYEQLRACG